MTDRSLMAVRRDEMKRRGQGEYVRRRREIIGAAANVFRKKGFRSASVADIAAAVGMDRASLYLYVASKEEAFQDVIQEAIEANVRMVEELRNARGGIPERLGSFITALLKSYSDNHPFLFVYVQENMNQLDDGSAWGRQMRSLGRRFDDALVALVQQGLDEGSIRTSGGANAKVVAYGLLGLCNWTHRWYDPAGACSMTQIGETYAGMVLNGLLPRQPA